MGGSPSPTVTTVVSYGPDGTLVCHRPPDLSKNDVLMEVPLRPWNPGPRQLQLQKWKQRLDPSKATVLRKSLNVLTLLMGFCSYTSG